MNYPKDLEILINHYQKLPGIGEKSAERTCYSNFRFSEEETNEFSEAMKKKLKRI